MCDGKYMKIVKNSRKPATPHNRWQDVNDDSKVRMLQQQQLYQLLQHNCCAELTSGGSFRGHFLAGLYVATTLVGEMLWKSRQAFTPGVRFKNMLPRTQVLGFAGVAVACAGACYERIRKRGNAIAFANDEHAAVSIVPSALKSNEAATPAEATEAHISSAVSTIDPCKSATNEELQATTHHVDVVIIGGGIVGCTVGYFLAKNNKEVAIIDRGPLCCCFGKLLQMYLSGTCARRPCWR